MAREPVRYFLQQFDGIVEAAIDQINRLAIEALQPRRQHLRGHLRRITNRIVADDLVRDDFGRGNSDIHDTGVLFLLIAARS
jgi:hypothetical protein